MDRESECPTRGGLRALCGPGASSWPTGGAGPVSKFCPINEIDWGRIFHQDRRPSIGNGEPDLEGELVGIDLLVSRYQSGYPDPAAKDWIERRLRAWWQGRSD